MSLSGPVHKKERGWIARVGNVIAIVIFCYHGHHKQFHIQNTPRERMEQFTRERERVCDSNDLH